MKVCRRPVAIDTVAAFQRTAPSAREVAASQYPAGVAVLSYPSQEEGQGRAGKDIGPKVSVGAQREEVRQALLRD